MVETVFHKFPAVFAYEARPEFPDIDRIRRAIKAAIRDGLVTPRLQLTDVGRTAASQWGEGRPLKLDTLKRSRPVRFD